MSSPVAIKVSAEFAASVRAEAHAADRSLTGQIEHWAKLGRAVERIMPVPLAAALKRSAGDPEAIEDPALRRKVLDAFASVHAETPEALRQKIGLDRQTRFEPDPEHPGGMIRTAPDGTRERGTMKGRTFVPSDS
jgi:hypothetical protein